MKNVSKEDLDKLSVEEKKELFKKLLKEKAASQASESGVVTKKTVVTVASEDSVSEPLSSPELFTDIQAFKKRYLEYSTINPFFRVSEGNVQDTTSISGRELISYSSYNYLGLSGHPYVSDAAKKAIEQYGTSVSASRMVSGERAIHQNLEKEIAHFLGTQDAVVLVSGHATNVTTIGHLFTAKDLILYDSLVHNSILQGCMLSGARRIPFAHNDPSQLENLLKQYRKSYEKTLIVIEGVYSMDGDIPDLPRFVELKKKYNATLMVDEAHSLGILGKTGKGIAEHFNIAPNEIDINMGTLSKTLASCGGYIAGSEFFIKYLRYTVPGFLYSVGISPANSAASLAALQVLQNEPERVSRLQTNSDYFLQKAKEARLDTGQSKDTSVIPVIIGNSDKCILMSNYLFEQGINAQPILYPAVEESATRVRFFITSEHTHDQIDYTIRKIKDGLETLGIKQP